MAETSDEFDILLDRIAAGDLEAREQLFARTYDRFRGLASRMLHQGFARVATFEQTDDVMQAVIFRLFKGWDRIIQEQSGAVLTDSTEYFCRVARLIREVLIDLARHHYGRHSHRPTAVSLQPGSDSISSGGHDPGSDTLDPQQLVKFTEFHLAVESLPSNLKQVVDLHWYQEFTHQEVAKLLCIGESTVRKYWVAARLQLVTRLGSNPFLGNCE